MIKGLRPVATMFVAMSLALKTTPTPLAAQSALSAQSAQPYNLWVLDEHRQRAYAVGGDGSSVVILALNYQQVIQVVSLGSTIWGLDLSPDGHELAAALPNVGQLAFVNLQSMEVITQVILPPGSYVPHVFDVAYGREGRLYVSDADNFDHILVLDSRTKTQVAQSPWPGVSYGRLVLSADDNTLYTGYDRQLQRLDVTTDAITVTAQQPSTDSRFFDLCVLDEDRIATSNGQILAADVSATLLQLPQWGLHIACSPSGDRVYLPNGALVYAFDTHTGALLWTWDFHTSLGDLHVNATGDRLYVATSRGLEWIATQPAAPVYLPAIYSPKLGVYGHVTLNGAPLAGVPLTLYRGDANGQSSIGYATSEADGSYFFPNSPSLQAGQWYWVEYKSGEFGQMDRVYRWQTRMVTAFITGAEIDMDTFDIAASDAVSPASDVSVYLPQMFQWTIRDNLPDETYEFVLIVPGFPEPIMSLPLGHVDRYTLTSLPMTLGLRSPYYWTVRIHDTHGGVGFQHWVYTVTFLDRGLNGLFDFDPRMGSQPEVFAP